MKTVFTPFPTESAALLAKLRIAIPTAVVPAFDQSLLMVQGQLNQLSEALLQSGQPDTYGADCQALSVAIDYAGHDFRGKLIDAVEALSSSAADNKYSFNLSLIEDEHMLLQLACERLVERLTYVQRKGLQTLDQRLCKILDLAPLGPHLPLSPQVLADAARESLTSITLADEFKAQVIQHFDLLVDPILSDLLKELNGGLAASGILPDLVIQDEEERVRRETIKTPAIGYANVATANMQLSDEAGGAAASNNSPYNRAIDDNDRALLTDLLDQIKNLQSRSLGHIAGSADAYGGNATALPQRAMAKSETLAMLDRLQHGSGNTNAFLDAIGRPDGSIADTIKQELSLSAKQMGITQGDEQATLALEEETAVQIAGNLFEVMLKDRPYGNAVAPIIAQMVMPFVRAAIIDPQLFLERHHPARQLLNTISEACEDNSGETPQERELLSHVETAVQHINEEYDGDIGKFQNIEAKLSSQMQSHRRRVQISEKRSTETQQGQERLENARLQAGSVVNNITRNYKLPSTLRHFFDTEWQHHLSVTASRKGTDSEAFTDATRVAQPWIDLLDLVSLDEPLPLSHLGTLETATLEVLANSGINDDASMELYQRLINDVSEWTDDVTMDSPVPELASTSFSGISTTVSIEESNQPVITNSQTVTSLPKLLPPSVDELKEVSAFGVGTWLQLPKADGGFQQLKIAWISGISGSVMLVNRKGARVLVLSPTELVDMKRRNALLIFEHVSPVDQGMRQLLDKLKRQ